MNLNDQAVVITGAGSGLGEAYAKGAAKLGAKIVVNDVNRENAERVASDISAAGGIAVSEPQDIRDPLACEALVSRCLAEFGKITGLVNNAGVFFIEAFENATLDHLRVLLDVNVIGTFNCAKAALQPMLRQGGGSIINVTSGAHAGQSSLSSYGASKGAVASFTYGWAHELREQGIRVNAVSPLAYTPMAKHLPHLPMPEVNVPPVLYLLSDASAGVTGQIVRITGRQLSLMSHPANRAPVLERDAWTAETISDAFATTLGGLQLPTDVATYEISSVTSQAN